MYDFVGGLDIPFGIISAKKHITVLSYVVGNRKTESEPQNDPNA